MFDEISRLLLDIILQGNLLKHLRLASLEHSEHVDLLGDALSEKENLLDQRKVARMV